MATTHFSTNPLFPQTTIFIGNGFDLSLGLKSRYTDYFNSADKNGKKNFWPVYDTVSEEDQLYKRLNGEYASFGHSDSLNEQSTWFDLENELKEHAKRSFPQGLPNCLDYEQTFSRDQKYFEEVKRGLMLYLIHEVKEWRDSRHTQASKSPAYQLLYQVCVHANADPNIITFNYTNILSLLEKCEGNLIRKIHINPDKIQHVHGSLSDRHIILGINEDRDVRKEYDFLFKSWDAHYCSHQVIDTLRRFSNHIFLWAFFRSNRQCVFCRFL